MSRTLTAAVIAALAGENVPLLVFMQLEFSSGTLRMTNAGYDTTWNGYTWIGAGSVLAVEKMQEGADLQARGVRLSLSGVPAAYIATALTEKYQGRTVTIWAAPLSASYTVLVDPVIVFKGRMDTMPITLGGGQAVIELNIESRFVDFERPRVRRYNDADQQKEYPGDLGFQFVEQMVEAELVWGRA